MKKIEIRKVKGAVELFLDSGAFSAFTQKTEVDLDAYIEFILEHRKDITIYANLDVIGDAVGTLKNQKKMEKAGLIPLPCFHPKEDYKYLKAYIRDYDYIALGGLASKLYGRQDMVRYLDTCWDLICDTPDRIPKVKVHGFGLTSLKLMLRYPWYSVDSTSWVIGGRMGYIYVPRWKGEQYAYDEMSWKVNVSARSPTRKDAGQHITTFSPQQQKLMLRYFGECGFVLGKSIIHTEREDEYELKKDEHWRDRKQNGMRVVEKVVEAGLCNDYKLRDELNIMYFLDLEESMPNWPWAWHGPKYRLEGGFGLT